MSRVKLGWAAILGAVLCGLLTSVPDLRSVVRAAPPTDDVQAFEGAEATLVDQLRRGQTDEERIAAARSIGAKRSDRFTDCLADAMGDPSQEVRKAVIKALADAATDQAVSELESAAADAEQLGSIRALACERLGVIAARPGGARALEALARLADFSDESVKKDAGVYLKRVVPKLDEKTLAAHATARTSSDAVRLLSQGELARRGVSPGKAGAGTSSAAPTVRTGAPPQDAAFTDADRAALNTWRAARLGELGDKVKALAKQRPSYKSAAASSTALKGMSKSYTKYREEQVKASRAKFDKQIGVLHATQLRMKKMPLADLGVMIQREAGAAASAAAGLRTWEAVADEFSNQVERAPRTATVWRDDSGNEWIEEDDNSMLWMMGRLAQALTGASAAAHEAQAKRNAQMLASLSSGAREAIHNRGEQLEKSATGKK